MLSTRPWSSVRIPYQVASGASVSHPSFSTQFGPSVDSYSAVRAALSSTSRMGPIVTIRSADAPEAVVAVTVVLPADTATTSPDASTRATVGSALVQPTTAPGTGWPWPSRTEVDRRNVSSGSARTAAP